MASSSFARASLRALGVGIVAAGALGASVGVARGATHAALLEDRGFASITSRAISDVVGFARSGQR